ncbi:hypothetical protein HK100_002473 [Physocladia obscura]|uniref:Uncharacterized protein n=1 Tax=Physocladia obscura TaxID=109957 RepID=A0AAD5XA77_9FUNG|nr:hypothetical protein HK100_002473 [Physocladia obscura]
MAVSSNSTLSIPARVTVFLGPPSVVILTALASPKTGLIAPLAFLPTAYAYKTWHALNKINPSRRAKLEPLVWTYVLSGTLGLVSVGVIQLVVCKAVAALLFRSGSISESEFWTEFGRRTFADLTDAESVKRLQIAASWKNWVFNAALSFVAAGFGEEVLKYLPIAYARRLNLASTSSTDDATKKTQTRIYLDYALASALSFSLIENIGFIYECAESGGESWQQLVISVFERIFVAGAAHVSVATLTALRATRRDYYGEKFLGGWLGVIWPAVLFHGTFNFVCFGASALEGNVGWVHPKSFGVTAGLIGICTGIVSSAAWLAKREWNSLEKLNRDVKDASDKRQS